MSEKTTIEWTDFTFNPWEGCTKVSAGCKNCYAEARNRRFGRGVSTNWGPGAPRRRTSDANWKLPLKWNRLAAREQEIWDDAIANHADDVEYMTSIGLPTRPRVFCASLADWLDPEVPVEWRAALLVLIKRTPHLDWQLLTKRPELWADQMRLAANFLDAQGAEVLDVASWLYWWTDTGGNSVPPSNVWAGTTVENQPAADERIPHLLNIPARVRFLSVEPLLEEVSLVRLRHENDWDPPRIPDGIHWVIVGGESGPNARPMDPEWARALKSDCKEAGVAFFMKQMGGVRKPFPPIPQDLRTRQFPEVKR